MRISKKWKLDKILTRPGDCTVEMREAKYARNCVGKAISINKHFNYSGSGPTAFGGAKKWPALTLKISFEENAFEQRDKMAKLLKETVNINM